MVMAGALPFGAVFIELFFILESLFENEFYYMFGMGLSPLLPSGMPWPRLSESTWTQNRISLFGIRHCYHCSCPNINCSRLLSTLQWRYVLVRVDPTSATAHPHRPHVTVFLDHYWMWKSFISGGGISLYVFGYLIYYHIVKLDITSFTPIVLYFRWDLTLDNDIGSVTGWKSTSMVHTVWPRNRKIHSESLAGF